MAVYRLRKGLLINWRGREYLIEKRLHNGDIQIQDVVTNEFSSASERDLISSLFDGNLDILGDPQETTGVDRQAARTLIEDLKLLPDKVRKEVRRRYAYVSAMVAARDDVKMVEQSIIKIVRDVAVKIKDASPPAWCSAYRWHSRFMASGNDVRSLVPATASRGNRRRKFGGKQTAQAAQLEKLIDDAISERYLTEQRLTVEAVHSHLVVRIDEENKFRAAGEQLPTPDRVSLYRIIAKLDPYEKTKARHGQHIADLRYKAAKLGPRPTRPLERTETDNTKLDLLVVDPVARLPLGRCTMTTLIDKYTTMVLGFYAGFEPPSYLTTMQCMKHAIKPKTYLRELYPSVKNEWDAYGIMELVVSDNGPEYYSDDLEDAALQLGTVIQYAPKKKPHYKGGNERYFKTQNEKLLHSCPGTTFSNILEREDYDPAKNAVITLDALLEMMHIFIVDVYNQSPNRRLQDIPARMWSAAIKEYPPALPGSRTDINVLIGAVDQRTVSPSGIEFECLQYDCDDLALLRRRLKTEGGKGAKKKVTFKYDPSDLSVIHVADIFNNKYIPVPCLNQFYAKGLSIWQHGVIKKYARENIKRHLDLVALCRAKETIQDIVDSEWLSTRKVKSRQKMARFTQREPAAYLQDRPGHASQDRMRLIAGRGPETMPLTPGVGWGGVSDGGTAYAVGETSLLTAPDAGGGAAADANAPALGAAAPEEAKPARSKGRRKKSAQLSPARAADESRAALPAADDGGAADDLDMSGWESDYGLTVSGGTKGQ